jgi:uncharacterized protein YbgA (DUF1722 family)
MNQINVDSILHVNGYHGSGQIRVRDRELVARVVQELRDENAVLRVRLGQLARENAELREGMAG